MTALSAAQKKKVYSDSGGRPQRRSSFISFQQTVNKEGRDHLSRGERGTSQCLRRRPLKKKEKKGGLAGERTPKVTLYSDPRKGRGKVYLVIVKKKDPGTNIFRQLTSRERERRETTLRKEGLLNTAASGKYGREGDDFRPQKKTPENSVPPAAEGRIGCMSATRFHFVKSKRGGGNLK